MKSKVYSSGEPLGKGNFPRNAHSLWGQYAWAQHGFSSIWGFICMIHPPILQAIVIYYTTIYLIIYPFKLLTSLIQVPLFSHILY